MARKFLEEINYFMVEWYMNNLKIALCHPDAKVPTRATAGSAGYDLYAVEDVELIGFNPKSGFQDPQKVRTGIKIRLPQGYEARIQPRSGMSLKGIRIVNSPGCVDSDFSDEVQVLMQYVGNWPTSYQIKKGDRIAQMVISKYEVLYMDLVDELDQTDRKGGFGSTGK